MPYIHNQGGLRKQPSQRRGGVHKDNKDMNQQASANAKRILVLDNDESTRSAMRFMLRRAGYAVHSAEHCDEVTGCYRESLMQGHPFDAVILDWDMRGGKGIRDTFRQLLELDPGVNAIVTSSKCDDLPVAGFRDCGFKATLAKPFTSEELEQAVYAIIHDSRQKKIPKVNKSATMQGGNHEIHSAA